MRRIRLGADMLLACGQPPASTTEPTDEENLNLARQWFVTGENQQFSEGHRYRSVGVPRNVKEAELLGFERAARAHGVLPLEGKSDD